MGPGLAAAEAMAAMAISIAIIVAAMATKVESVGFFCILLTFLLRQLAF